MLTLQRNSLLSNIFTALLWLLVFASSQSLQSQDKINVEIKQYYPLDICGEVNRQRVVLVISSDPIVKEDMLYGFDFEIKYNPEKLKFHTALYTGTMAEFFDYKDVIFSDTGKLRGFAVNMSMQTVSGDRPLIAFWGDYLSKCADTTLIEFNYFDFTDEFKRKKVNLKELALNVEIIDKPERFMNLQVDKDTLFFENTDIEKNVKLSSKIMNNNFLDSLRISIEYEENDNYDILSIQSLDDKVELYNYQKMKNKVSIDANFKNGIQEDIEFAEISIVNKIKNENDYKIEIIPETIDHCSCITRLNSAKCVLSNRISSNKEEMKKDLFKINYKREIKNIEVFTNYEIKRIELYDIRGSIVSYTEIENKLFFNIDVSQLNNGIYIAKVDLKNGKREMIKVCIN